MLAINTVKPFLLHSEQVVRQFAVTYFHESLSQDPELMSLVLESCRRYPRNESRLRILSNSYNFKQDSKTIREILSFIHEDPQNRDNYEQILANCDLSVLKELNLDLKSLLPYTQKVLEQRLKVASRLTLDLWEDLLKHSAEAAQIDPQDYNLNYGTILVKELAYRSDFDSKKVIERLNFPYGPNYKGYDLFYLCMLAGELGLTDVIPLLLQHLTSPEEFFAQGAKEALIRIGNKEVINRLSAQYQTGKGNLRIAIADVLGHIKLEAAEKLVLELLSSTLKDLEDNKNILRDPQLSTREEALEREKSFDYRNRTIATNLAKSLCNLLSVEGIPLVQKLIGKGYNSEITMLEQNLYTCCRITGIELPELEHYNRLIEEENDRYRLAKTAVYFHFNKNAKINRNDPCPCGSGNKYKKCCGDK